MDIEDGHIVLGKREQWGREAAFTLSTHDRRHHLYVIGKSGTGKTTLLRNMIVQDILLGHGVGLLDPHGDLATEILDIIPSHRIEDLAYFAPADMEHPVGFNVLGRVPPHDREIVASRVISAFKNQWADSWGPRLEYILKACLLALLDCENVSLLGVPRILSDAMYRRWVLKQVKDPMVRYFWECEYESYTDRFLQEAIAPVQNKVGQLLMSGQLRNVLGQVRSRIKPRFMMDNKKIFIADLSKGKLGQDKSSLIGSFLISQFQTGAMARANIPEQERKDFFLYADEFQSFATDSFCEILSEARKYRLCLTLSHQYIEQVKPEVRAAVFGNVGSMVSFRIGESDAEVLEWEFGHAYTSSQFTGLGNHEVCAKILNDGQYREPFVAKTLPPIGMRKGNTEKIVRRSREKYSMRQNIIEGKVKRWLGRSPH